MHTGRRLSTLAALTIISGRLLAQTPTTIPTDWIDSDTGHRVVRLSKEDDSQSSYFHQYEFTADGKKLVFTSPTGIYTVDLETHVIEQIRAGAIGIWPSFAGGCDMVCVGRKTGLVYYVLRGDQGTTLHTVDPNTKADTKVVDVPPGLGIANINCDETLAGGAIDLRQPKEGGGNPNQDTPPNSVRSGGRPRPGAPTGTYSSDLDMELVTLSLKTGEVKKVIEEHAFINHIQFSPTDPQQMLFCHEGYWQLVDRTWLIRTDGSGLVNVQPRLMNMQVNGHEFFSPDGKNILYDLQTPARRVFWVGSYSLTTKILTWYNLKKDEWSVHYNMSPDQSLLCGDGGGPHSVAAPDNGPWMYLFHPHLIRLATGGASDPSTLIQSGYLEAEKLVNLSKQDYTYEPNGQFTPDGKWIVFRSKMFGPMHIFAVEVAKARQ